MREDGRNCSISELKDCAVDLFTCHGCYGARYCVARRFCVDAHYSFFDCNFTATITRIHPWTNRSEDGSCNRPRYFHISFNFLLLVEHDHGCCRSHLRNIIRDHKRSSGGCKRKIRQYQHPVLHTGRLEACNSHQSPVRSGKENRSAQHQCPRDAATGDAGSVDTSLRLPAPLTSETAHMAQRHSPASARLSPRQWTGSGNSSTRCSTIPGLD